MRRFLSAFWLALALLVGQQGAALHALSHATEQIQQKKDSAPAPACDLCFAYAQFSGAAGAKASALPAVAATSVAALFFLVAATPAAAWLAYRSQAPPRLL